MFKIRSYFTFEIPSSANKRFYHFKISFMKSLIIIAFYFIAIDLPAQNSLSNTRWQGTFFIPNAVDVNLNFSKDTLYMTTESGQEVGTIFFTQQKDTLIIRKISGPSPCPEEKQGIYRIEWFDEGNQFRLYGISDECEGRVGVFTVNPFKRVHNK